MRTPQKLAGDYIAVWNARNEPERRALLAATWDGQAGYADPLMAGKGLDQINGLIAAVHDRFPDFYFALLGKADGHGSAVRFSWSLGPKGSDPVIKGTDFVIRDGDLIASVTGFLDLVPEQL